MEQQPTDSPPVDGPARVIETVFRMQSPRVIAGVARIVRDVAIAEELAQDALVAALERRGPCGVRARRLLAGNERERELLRARAEDCR
ncbi:hypothetical protein ACFQ0G_22245 [Streptomyces chiangmaiensis]